LVLNTLCYILGWRTLGKKFVVYSAISTGGFSLAYYICELFDPLWPQLAEMPLVAAIAGAAFVGVGAGLCVRIGGATGGDDAFAMSLSKLLHCNIAIIYLAADVIVLALSLTYIPLNRILYSLLTVVLSGQIVGLIQRIGVPKKPKGGKLKSEPSKQCNGSEIDITNNDESTANTPAEYTEVKDAPAVSAEHTEVKPTSAVPAEHTEEKDAPAVPAEHTEEKDAPAVPAEHDSTPKPDTP